MIGHISFIAALLILGASAGGTYFLGREAGQSECQVSQQERDLALAALWRAEVARHQARAEALQQQLASSTARTRTIYQEVIREIPTATLGRPCLSDDALGLLDRFQSSLEPREGVSTTTSESADPGGTVASDTQVAQWAAAVIEQHEYERARCNALIGWHLRETP